MLVYCIIIIITFVLFLCSIGLKNLNKCKKTFMFFTGVMLIYFAANRGLDVGTDTYAYYIDFLFIETNRFSRTFQGVQIGWLYFNLLINRFLDYNLFMYICYTGIISFTWMYIYKLSKQFMLSILLFVLLYFYFNSFNGMRQLIAISIVLFGYTFLSEEKKFFIICVLCASLFHFSALLMLPLYYIDKFKFSSFTIYTLVFFSFFIGIFFHSSLTEIISIVSYLDFLNEGVSGYINNYGGQRNIFSNLIINIVFIVTFYLSNKKGDLLLMLYFLYIVCNNLFGAGGNASRFFWYFQIAQLIVLPNTWIEIKGKVKRFLYLSFILVYSYSIFHFSISSNASEIVPYVFR